jgi:DNA-binding NarL/FixJ family response regulator
MMTTASRCRTYIVYHHGLFAQGVRSVLETRRTVEIVGMETDVAKALRAVQSLQPEVIIVEECTGKHQPMRLGAFLHSATSGRVVTLSLDHDSATVYQRNRMAATDPADLVRAIQGVGKSQTPGADQPRPKASMLFQPESGRNGDPGRSGWKPRLRSTKKQVAQVSDKLPRKSRGSRKGG